jgi:N-acetylated-alpha-linked acidic dipeptidase
MFMICRRSRLRRTTAGLLFFTLASSLTAQQAGSQLPGFAAQSGQSEVTWEQRFKSLPDPQRMRDNMQRLSARPHHVGSPYDKEDAEWILAQYKHLDSFASTGPIAEEVYKT